MNKYSKIQVKTIHSKNEWLQFVATKRDNIERFRTTKELHDLIESRVKEIQLTKSQYLTDLILIDCGYKEHKGDELIEGVNWELGE